jgi:hypothetical protein
MPQAAESGDCTTSKRKAALARILHADTTRCSLLIPDGMSQYYANIPGNKHIHNLTFLNISPVLRRTRLGAFRHPSLAYLWAGCPQDPCCLTSLPVRLIRASQPSCLALGDSQTSFPTRVVVESNISHIRPPCQDWMFLALLPPGPLMENTHNCWLVAYTLDMLVSNRLLGVPPDGIKRKVERYRTEALECIPSSSN